MQISFLVLCNAQNMSNEDTHGPRFNHPNKGELYYNGAFPLDVTFLKKHKIKSLYLDDHDVTVNTLSTIADYGNLAHLEFGVRAEGVSMPDGAEKILQKLNKIEVLVFRISNWNGSEFSFLSEMQALHSLSIFPTITKYPTMSRDVAESIAKCKSITSATLYMMNIDNEIIRHLALAKNLTVLVIGGPIDGDTKARTVQGLSEFGDRKLESMEVRFTK